MATCPADAAPHGDGRWRPDAPAKATSNADFERDCVKGLTRHRKSLPCKWLYDDAGSQLFEQITALPEYYPSRTEEALLRGALPAVADGLAYGTTLVELGSGASRKTRLLLDAAPAIATYVPIDISGDELERAARTIRADYPGLTVRPIHADFTNPDAIDLTACEQPILLFFPGSTLGNFAPEEAQALLRAWREAAGPGARLLLGVDVIKDEATLVRAYDDAAGVTAAFNLNLLRRMNRELGCRVDVDGFAHRAVWNRAAQRVEMHLVARKDTRFRVGGVAITLKAGETIHTESSHKLPRDRWVDLFAGAGWRKVQIWANESPAFMLALLAS